MPHSYALNNIQGITKKSGSKKTGHVVHSAYYQTKAGTMLPIFYKENKHGKAQASLNEVAISELARLFMRPHSTPPYHLVTGDDGGITGVACHNICLSIAQRVDLKNTQFMTVKAKGKAYAYHQSTKVITDAEKIPYKFLNELPQGYFAHLMQDRKAGKLDIDMDSLANILVGKYTLEEDDLHKQNIGFYLTQKAGKPYVTFLILIMI